jgi:hypothetical protein
MGDGGVDYFLGPQNSDDYFAGSLEPFLES